MDGYWPAAQNAFDLMEAKRKIGSDIRNIEPYSQIRLP
jgi:hypothetical protein